MTKNRTIPIEHENNGKPRLKILWTDADGTPTKDSLPVLDIGLKKARILMDHIDDIVDFVKKHDDLNNEDSKIA